MMRYSVGLGNREHSAQSSHERQHRRCWQELAQESEPSVCKKHVMREQKRKEGAVLLTNKQTII